MKVWSFFNTFTPRVFMFASSSTDRVNTNQVNYTPCLPNEKDLVQSKPPSPFERVLKVTLDVATALIRLFTEACNYCKKAFKAIKKKLCPDFKCKIANNTNENIQGPVVNQHGVFCYAPIVNPAPQKQAETTKKHRQKERPVILQPHRGAIARRNLSSSRITHFRNSKSSKR
jgi:hypothetical protein